MRTITKTLSLDGYVIADRLLEGCLFVAEATLNDDGHVTLKLPITVSNSVRNYLKSLGASGTDEHWIKQAKDHMNQQWADEELGEAMSDEEWSAWESVLMGETTMEWIT